MKTWRFWLLSLVIVGWQSGCGSTVSNPTPVSPLPSTPPAPVVDISGNWTGTFESANLPAHTINLTVVQAGNCVDGAWLSQPSDWSGAISGIAETDSYVGQMSLERTDASGRCSALALVTGPVGGSTLRWTATAFNATGSCAGELPQGVVITLQRR